MHIRFNAKKTILHLDWISVHSGPFVGKNCRTGKGISRFSYLLQFFILLIHSWSLYTYVKFSYSTPLTSHLPIIMHTLLLALANTYHLVTYMHYRLRPYL